MASVIVAAVELLRELIKVIFLIHSSSKVPLNGWAFESRVYAEDPFKNFGLPSIGRLHRYIEPNDIPRVR